MVSVTVGGAMLDRLEALERKVAQMVIRGKVEQADYAARRVRVRYGPEQLTGWLEWKPRKSGEVTVWEPPQIGEGATVISPDGNLDLGEVYLGSYHDTMPAPSVDPMETVMQWPDGTIVRYNREQHKLTVHVEGAARVEVTRGADIEVGEDATVKAGGEIRADAKAIRLNGGAGVVTGNHICQISGKPHSDCSSTVCAGK